MIYLKLNKKLVTIYDMKKTKLTTNKQIPLKQIANFKIKEEKNTIKASDYKITVNNITRKEHITLLFQNLKKEKIIISQKKNILEDFLKEYIIKYKVYNLCDSCLNNDTLTIITNKSSHKHNRHVICEKCLDNLIIEMLYDYGYSNHSFNRFKNIYEKKKDLNLVFDMIENEYDPVENPELTLYDMFEQTEDNFAKVSIDTVSIPTVFKNILKKKIDYLLPVQILALNEGLLYNENLLVVSQTASGKTLIAELAGITKALQMKKFIYLSPLVALANQKYRQFKRDYEKLGLNIAIKVGKNRVHAKDELTIEDMSVEDADIIVATYEGLDFILRSGKYHMLDDLGVVVIDEIHMLENIERGSRLNGLIKRLIYLYPHSQIIGLSATINNPEELADEFNMTLVEYDKRPVSLQRHIIFSDTSNDKKRIIKDLCKKEFDTFSSKNFRGQTIIFTDSRRNTNILANYLKKNGVNAEYYHAGLTYANKIRIEEAFYNQEISTVVTTAALAAGVDFPASQVIFDSLRMGNKWLTNNEFHQMLGRAGRPSFHDTGVVYLLPVTNSYMNNISEENIAYKLLDSNTDNINVIYGTFDVYEQILSDISCVSVVDLKELKLKYDNIELPILFSDAVNQLYEYDMIEYNLVNKKYNITEYGRATAMSFLRIDEAEMIRNNITSNPIDIITRLNPINNAYLSNSLIKSFERILNFHISIRLFSDSTKELLTQGYFIKQLSKKHQNQLNNFHNDLMICDCWDYPYCNCLERNISRHIIKRRLEGLSPLEISNEFLKKYNVNIYSGDIYNWLDQMIRYCESICRIALSLEIPNVSEECEKLTNRIEYGCDILNQSSIE